ncbi:MAG: mandelate racemase/muconate lactonizing enzyme family protein, partial [Dehalococcoidia bacterium]
MKIASFETSAVRVPREHSPNTPGGDTVDFVPVTLRTDDGVTGIGYAGFASQMLTKGLKEVVDAACEQVIGDDPMDTEAIAQRLLRIGGGGAPAGLLTRAVAAIDVALWDIKGKALGQPVAKLLGGYRDSVPAYASGFLWRSFDLEALAEHGQRLASEGFTSMKFRMGGEDTPAKEIARLRTIRGAVGDDVELMVDINQGWDVNQAITIGREMDLSRLFWLEDPVHHQDYAGLARIADALDTPIAAGEYHYGIAPFRHMLEHRSIDIVMVDLLRVGGLTQWMKVAHMAEAFNLPVVTHLAPEILVHA